MVMLDMVRLVPTPNDCAGGGSSKEIKDCSCDATGGASLPVELSALSLDVALRISRSDSSFALAIACRSSGDKYGSASELARPLIPEGAGLTIIAGVPSWKMLLKSK